MDNNEIPNKEWFENPARQRQLASILGEGVYDPVLDEVQAVLSEGSDPDTSRRDQDLLQNSFPPKETPGVTVAEMNSQAFKPTILTWEEFLSQPSEKQEWIIEGVLRPGWLAVLGGHGKQGKTTLAIHLLNALSQGIEFINGTSAVPALHLNFEMGDDDIKELIRSVSGDSQLKINAKIINQLPVPLDLKWLESFLTKEELPGVCVIDSFRAAFMLAGDSENQAGTVGVILRTLQTIARRTKWSIIVIHHFRKSGTGEALDLAGSGEWLSAPDVIYTWSCPKPKEPGTLGITGRVPPAEPLAIRLSREKIEFLGTVGENNTESERASILSTLTDEPLQSNQIAELTSLPEATVRRRLGELFDNNKVQCEGAGKKGNPFLWSKCSDQSLNNLSGDQQLAVVKSIFGEETELIGGD